MAFRATYLALLAVTVVGQLAALGFEIAVAARFGTGRDADALAFALMLVVTLTGELASWVSAIVVPLYLAARATSVTGAAAFLRRVFAALLLVAGLIVVLLAVAAPVVVRVLAPALGPRGIAVLQAFAPLLVFAPLAALFGAALQAHGRFAGAGARQLAWYGGGLVAVILLGPAWGVLAVPFGIVAGMAMFAAALAVPARALTRSADGADRGPSLARVGTLLLPLALLSAALLCNVAVERALAARLPEGSLAALTYAYRLLHFPLALFLVNATAMLLPTMAGHAARGEDEISDALTRRALRVTLVFVVPLAALAIALAEPLTAVLLQRGAFTASSTASTATAIAWYAPSIVTAALIQVLLRVYQARQALWRLAAMVGASIAVNIVLMAGLTALAGFRGLPLAASLSGVVLVALMLRGLRDRAPGLAGVLTDGASVAVVGAGLAALAAAWLVRDLAAGALPALVLGAAAGAGVYAGALATLAPNEARAALAVLVPAASSRPA